MKYAKANRMAAATALMQFGIHQLSSTIRWYIYRGVERLGFFWGRMMPEGFLFQRIQIPKWNSTQWVVDDEACCPSWQPPGLSISKWHIKTKIWHRPHQIKSTPIFQHLLWLHLCNGLQTHIHIKVKTLHKYHYWDDLCKASYFAQLYILVPLHKCKGWPLIGQVVFFWFCLSSNI